MTEPIRIVIEHRIEEHVRAERLFHARRSFFARVDKVVAVLLAAVGVAGIALAGVRWWTVIWLVLAPLELFDLLSIAPLVTRYRFRRNPKLAEPSRLVLGEEGIHFQTSTIDSRISWSLYESVLEDAELLLLVYAGSMYTVIPKRCLESPQQLDAFRALVAAKVGAGMGGRPVG